MSDASLLNLKNSHASPTPVVEGERVYVHFGAEGTAALTTSGDVLSGRRAFPTYRSTVMAVPRSCTTTCSLSNIDGYDQSFVVAADKNSGEVRWKTMRLEPFSQAYSTPPRDTRR